MNFVLERIRDPEIEPVTVPEMKRYLRLHSDLTEEDEDIAALIRGGREWVESYTGRCLVDQTWRLSIGERISLAGTELTGGSIFFTSGEWPPQANGLMLRRSPVISLVAVYSTDTEGLSTDISAGGSPSLISAYEVRGAESRWPRLVALGTTAWPATDVVSVEFRAGFADLSASPAQDPTTVVPVVFRQAIKLWVLANYDHDDNMQKYLEVAERVVCNERATLSIA